jgi:hypothetical protein
MAFPPPLSGGLAYFLEQSLRQFPHIGNRAFFLQRPQHFFRSFLLSVAQQGEPQPDERVLVSRIQGKGLFFQNLDSFPILALVGVQDAQPQGRADTLRRGAAQSREDGFAFYEAALPQAEKSDFSQQAGGFRLYWQGLSALHFVGDLFFCVGKVLDQPTDHAEPGGVVAGRQIELDHVGIRQFAFFGHIDVQFLLRLINKTF